MFFSWSIHVKKHNCPDCTSLTYLCFILFQVCVSFRLWSPISVGLHARRASCHGWLTTSAKSNEERNRLKNIAFENVVVNRDLVETKWTNHETKMFDEFLACFFISRFNNTLGWKIRMTSLSQWVKNDCHMYRTQHFQSKDGVIIKELFCASSFVCEELH